MSNSAILASKIVFITGTTLSIGTVIYGTILTENFINIFNLNSKFLVAKTKTISDQSTKLASSITKNSKYTCTYKNKDYQDCFLWKHIEMDENKNWVDLNENKYESTDISINKLKTSDNFLTVRTNQKLFDEISLTDSGEDNITVKRDGEKICELNILAKTQMKDIYGKFNCFVGTRGKIDEWTSFSFFNASSDAKEKSNFKCNFEDMAQDDCTVYDFAAEGSYKTEKIKFLGQKVETKNIGSNNYFLVEFKNNSFTPKQIAKKELNIKNSENKSNKLRYIYPTITKTSNGKTNLIFL